MITDRRRLYVSDLVMVVDEETPYWTATFKVQSIADHAKLKPGDLIDVDIGVTTYSFFITEKERSIDGSENGPVFSMTLKAASPVIALSSRYSPKQDFIVEAAVYARDFVEGVVGSTVEWNIVDWMIPAGRIQFRSIAPLEAIQTVLNAAGAILQSKPDGSLYAQYKYPVTTTQYDSVTPDYSFNDVEAILSLSERDEYQSGANRFRVLESSGGFSDKFDWRPSESDPETGILRFYPYPWRTDFEVVANVIGYPVLSGVLEVEELTETVEFKNGVGNTQAPITSVQSVTWLTPSLGAVAVMPYSTELSVNSGALEGHGVAVVIYQSSYYTYGVSGYGAHQFIAREV